MAADQMGGLAFSRERDGLHRHEAAELPRRYLGARFALIGPEERGGRDIHPLEAALDRLEVRGDEIAHLRIELVDEESAARPDHLGGRFGDRVADTRRKGRER